MSYIDFPANTVTLQNGLVPANLRPAANTDRLLVIGEHLAVVQSDGTFENIAAIEASNTFDIRSGGDTLPITVGDKDFVYALNADGEARLYLNLSGAAITISVVNTITGLTEIAGGSSTPAVSTGGVLSLDITDRRHPTTFEVNIDHNPSVNSIPQGENYIDLNEFTVTGTSNPAPIADVLAAFGYSTFADAPAVLRTAPTLLSSGVEITQSTAFFFQYNEGSDHYRVDVPAGSMLFRRLDGAGGYPQFRIMTVNDIVADDAIGAEVTFQHSAQVSLDGHIGLSTAGTIRAEVDRNTRLLTLRGISDFPSAVRMEFGEYARATDTTITEYTGSIGSRHRFTSEGPETMIFNRDTMTLTLAANGGTELSTTVYNDWTNDVNNRIVFKNETSDTFYVGEVDTTASDSTARSLVIRIFEKLNFEAGVDTLIRNHNTGATANTGGFEVLGFNSGTNNTLTFPLIVAELSDIEEVGLQTISVRDADVSNSARTVNSIAFEGAGVTVNQQTGEAVVNIPGGGGGGTDSNPNVPDAPVGGDGTVEYNLRRVTTTDHTVNATNSTARSNASSTLTNLVYESTADVLSANDWFLAETDPHNPLNIVVQQQRFATGSTWPRSNNLHIGLNPPFDDNTVGRPILIYENDNNWGLYRLTGIRSYSQIEASYHITYVESAGVIPQAAVSVFVGDSLITNSTDNRWTWTEDTGSGNFVPVPDTTPTVLFSDSYVYSTPANFQSGEADGEFANNSARTQLILDDMGTSGTSHLTDLGTITPNNFRVVILDGSTEIFSSLITSTPVQFAGADDRAFNVADTIPVLTDGSTYTIRIQAASASVSSAIAIINDSGTPVLSSGITPTEVRDALGAAAAADIPNEAAVINVGGVPSLTSGVTGEEVRDVIDAISLNETAIQNDGGTLSLSTGVTPSSVQSIIEAQDELEIPSGVALIGGFERSTFPTTRYGWPEGSPTILSSQNFSYVEGTVRSGDNASTFDSGIVNNTGSTVDLTAARIDVTVTIHSLSSSGTAGFNLLARFGDNTAFGAFSSEFTSTGQHTISDIDVSSLYSSWANGQMLTLVIIETDSSNRGYDYTIDDIRLSFSQDEFIVPEIYPISSGGSDPTATGLNWFGQEYSLGGGNAFDQVRLVDADGNPIANNSTSADASNTILSLFGSDSIDITVHPTTRTATFDTRVDIQDTLSRVEHLEEEEVVIEDYHYGTDLGRNLLYRDTLNNGNVFKALRDIDALHPLGRLDGNWNRITADIAPSAGNFNIRTINNVMVFEINTVDSSGEESGDRRTELEAVTANEHIFFVGAAGDHHAFTISGVTLTSTTAQISTTQAITSANFLSTSYEIRIGSDALTGAVPHWRIPITGEVQTNSSPELVDIQLNVSNSDFNLIAWGHYTNRYEVTVRIPSNRAAQGADQFITRVLRVPQRDTPSSTISDSDTSLPYAFSGATNIEANRDRAGRIIVASLHNFIADIMSDLLERNHYPNDRIPHINATGGSSDVTITGTGTNRTAAAVLTTGVDIEDFFTVTIRGQYGYDEENTLNLLGLTNSTFATRNLTTPGNQSVSTTVIGRNIANVIDTNVTISHTYSNGTMPETVANNVRDLINTHTSLRGRFIARTEHVATAGAIYGSQADPRHYWYQEGVFHTNSNAEAEQRDTFIAPSATGAQDRIFLPYVTDGSGTTADNNVSHRDTAFFINGVLQIAPGNRIRLGITTDRNDDVEYIVRNVVEDASGLGLTIFLNRDFDRYVFNDNTVIRVYIDRPASTVVVVDGLSTYQVAGASNDIRIVPQPTTGTGTLSSIAIGNTSFVQGQTPASEVLEDTLTRRYINAGEASGLQLVSSNTLSVISNGSPTVNNGVLGVGNQGEVPTWGSDGILRNQVPVSAPIIATTAADVPGFDALTVGQEVYVNNTNPFNNLIRSAEVTRLNPALMCLPRDTTNPTNAVDTAGTRFVVALAFLDTANNRFALRNAADAANNNDFRLTHAQVIEGIQHAISTTTGATLTAPQIGADFDASRDNLSAWFTAMGGRLQFQPLITGLEEYQPSSVTGGFLDQVAGGNGAAAYFNDPDVQTNLATPGVTVNSQISIIVRPFTAQVTYTLEAQQGYKFYGSNVPGVNDTAGNPTGWRRITT